MSTSARRKVAACLRLCAIFPRQLLLSSWAVARAAFAREPRYQPAVLALPLRLHTDLGIATLANVISLTPGTTSLHVSDDRRTLYIHCLDAASDDATLQGIRRTFENTILEIER